MFTFPCICTVLLTRYLFPDSLILYLQCDNLRDVRAAHGHRKVLNVLLHLVVHRTRRTERRAHDWRCL